MKTIKFNNFFLLPTTILFIIVLAQVNFVQCNYNIREGDTFVYKISKLRGVNGLPLALSIAGLVLEEGISLRLKFTLVDIPFIKYQVTIGGDSAEFAILSNVIVQNRSWSKLTEEYENQGYTIINTDKIWGVVQNDTMEILVEYVKKDGVIHRFYAYDHPTLVTELGVKEVYIIRTSGNIKNNWAYSFFAVIPITAVIIGVVFYNKKITNQTKNKK